VDVLLMRFSAMNGKSTAVLNLPFVPGSSIFYTTFGDGRQANEAGRLLRHAPGIPVRGLRVRAPGGDSAQANGEQGGPPAARPRRTSPPCPPGALRRRPPGHRAGEPPGRRVPSGEPAGAGCSDRLSRGAAASRARPLPLAADHVPDVYAHEAVRVSW